MASLLKIVLYMARVVWLELVSYLYTQTVGGTSICHSKRAWIEEIGVDPLPANAAD